MDGLAVRLSTARACAKATCGLLLTLGLLAAFGPADGVARRARRPDLVVTGVALSALRVVPGGTLSASDSTSNVGPRAAGASRTGYYLSADRAKGRGDRLAASRRVGPLARRAHRAGHQKLAAPKRQGTYHVIVCADLDRAVDEDDERNNCRVSGVLRVATPPDRTPPGPPVIGGATPPSGSDTPTTTLEGSAEADSTVRVYGRPSCAGAPVGSSTAAGFVDPGISVPAPQGVTTSFSASAADRAGNTSECSAAFAFDEVAVSEVEPNDDSVAADARTRDAGVVFDRARTFVGELSMAADKDLFEVRVGSPATLSVTTSGGACFAVGTQTVSLLSGDGSTVLESTAADGCPSLSRAVSAGTYYASLESGLQAEGVGYTISTSLGPGAIPTGTSPASPADDLNPRIIGDATPGSTVDLFTTADCSGSPVASAGAASFKGDGIPVAVAPATTTVFHARARMGDGVGACSKQTVRYANSAPPPTPPSIDSASPSSGSDTATTKLRGKAPAGSTVRVYRGASCKASAVAAGTAAAYADVGVSVAVDQATTTTFSVDEVDSRGFTSDCSAPFAFDEVASAEVEPNDTSSGADGAAAAFGVVVDHARQFDGVLASSGDPDVYRIHFSTRTTLTLRTDAKPQCAPGADPRMTLLAGDGTTAIASADDSLGTRCPLLSRTLAAGTYYVVVEASGTLGGATGYVLKAATGPFAAPYATDPPSPSSSTLPRVLGLATAGAKVEVFATDTCSGEPAATATADELASPGISVPVPFGSSQTFRTRAIVDGSAGSCSATGVHYDNGAAEKEPNDTIAQAAARSDEGVAIADDSGYAAKLEPASDADVYAIHLATPTTLRLRTFDASGASCAAPVDTVMTLLTPNGGELASNDDVDAAQGQLCSRLEQRLNAGTYYVRVENFAEGTPTTYAYSLEATQLPEATISGTDPGSPAAVGSPRVKGSAPSGSSVELYTRAKCAGTPAGEGSAADLASTGIEILVGANRRRPILARVTSHGVVGPCTDSGFTYESTLDRPATTHVEVEPNDDKAGADAQGFDAAPGDVLAGQLAAFAAPDLFRVILPEGPVRLETFDYTAGDCPTTAFDTKLRLYAADGATAVATDDDSGIGFCDAIVRSVAAGTYYVEVANAGAGPALDYRVAITAPADAGAESEPDDAPATAVSLSGRDLTVRGAHQEASDQDWYRISVPAGRSVRAEVTEPGATGPSCSDGSTDSQLALYGPNGSTALASDDDGGRGACSLVDGTGSAPADAGAFDLPGGDYYLRVGAGPNGDSSSHSFDYRLNVVIR